MLRGHGLMKQVLLRLNWKSKTSLSSRKDSITVFLQNLQILERIRCLTLGTNGEEEEIHLVSNLLVPNVVRNIWVNPWGEVIIALVMERVAIRL